MKLTFGIQLESGFACFSLVGNLILPGPLPAPRRLSLWQRIKREAQDTWADLRQGVQEAWAICEIAAAALAFGLSQQRGQA